MSDVLSFATPRRQARATLLAGWIDGGAIMVLTAPRPASADDAITTQTTLVTFLMPDPCGTPEDGVWDADPLPSPAVIVADGTPVWARIFDDLGAVVADCDVGIDGSGSALELDNLDLVEGAMATATSLSIVEG